MFAAPTDLENFWIKKIEALQTQKMVSDFLLSEPDWKQFLLYNYGGDRVAEDFGKKIALEIYDKAVINVTPTPANLTDLLLDLPPNDQGKSAIAEYLEIVHQNMVDFDKNYVKEVKDYLNLSEKLERLLEKVFRYKVDWKDGHDAASGNGSDDARSYYHHLKKNVLQGRSLKKILKSEQRLKQRIEKQENQIKTACGLDATDRIPVNWENDFNILLNYVINSLAINDITLLPVIPAGENLTTLLARVNHTCPTATPCTQAPSDYTTRHTESEDYKRISSKLNNKISDNELNTLKNKSDHYQRIHTKLSGKISNDELESLLNSHSNYDTVKQERDRLKTDQANHKCDYDSTVAAKEKEIITKIITDCSLSTERERENVLEAVIAEIKSKITPPADNTDSTKTKELSAEQSKITELEAEITRLQNLQSLQDLPINNQAKEESVKISQKLNLTTAHQAKLEKATSYQELSTIQQEVFQERLNSEVSGKKNANYLNWGLGALSLGSLLVLAWILMKRTSFPPKIGSGKGE